MTELVGTATFSLCEKYRYTLSRKWSDTGGSCLFVMLNPSTADAEVLDPTIRRCLSFARGWGFGELWIGNVYALRSTDPKALWSTPDPVGPDNDAALTEMAAKADRIICAWGVHGVRRAKWVTELLRRAHSGPLLCLSKTIDGSPGHPLYLKKDLVPQEYAAAK